MGREAGGVASRSETWLLFGGEHKNLEAFDERSYQ